MSRKEEIVSRAIDIAVKDGLKSVTIKNLAEACGITEPAIYRHFKSKEDIIIAVIDRLQSNVQEVIAKGTKKVTLRSLKMTINEILDLLEKLRGIGVLLLSESAYTNNAVIKERLFNFYNVFVGAFEDFYRRLKESGKISGQTDCKALAIVTVSIFQSASVRYVLSDGKVSIKHKIPEIISLILKGVTCD
ncbi:MAG: TetR/AcrR family transcriptional regulator [Nitrospirae bacterium]|nr:TetR/AcrR family transcriptional regulator [Nitrospirota bacterium]